MAIIGMEVQGWSHKEAEEKLVHAIKSNLSKVFQMTKADGCSTDEAGKRIADRRLSSA
jgi:glutamate dehydrogenase/leucine dehydrogenase